ncbi:metallophosphoesterase [bacterium]|nr:metallophosphoesterase [bacterium]
MRYLVFGDIHGNVAALDAVLELGARLGVDAYLCLGDIVGYGPDPLACIERLAPLHRDQRLAWVAGNHDRVVRGEFEPVGYGAEAVETLRWVRRLLDTELWALDFLAAGQLVAKVSGGIWLTHDSLAAPGSGLYHRGTENAQVELGQLTVRQGRVCFYGHTHSMRAELLAPGHAVVLAPLKVHGDDGRDPAPLRLGPDERAWLGTGSTGFLTNKNRAAECVVLDDTDWALEKYAVPYPRETTRQRVREVLGPVCTKEVVDRLVRWL